MDIDKLIRDETVRERALYERVKAAELEMEPFKHRYESIRAEWSESYNRTKTLKQMKELLSASENQVRQDAKVLASDRRELAASEPAKVETAPACLPWGNRGIRKD